MNGIAGEISVRVRMRSGRVPATVTSVATGLWNDPATWDTGVPLSTDDVVVGAGTTVTINTTPLTMNSLTVNGTLHAQPGAKDAVGQFSLTFTE